MRPFRKRRDERLAQANAIRAARKLLREDIVALGERFDTVNDQARNEPLDTYARLDLEQAVASCESATAALAQATDDSGLAAVTGTLNDGRFHVACAIARRDGVDLPQLRTPCYFNPQHGPIAKVLWWTPPIGDAREVGVCRADLERLEAGEEPDFRLVRVGDRYVKWHEADLAAELLPDVGRPTGRGSGKPNSLALKAHRSAAGSSAAGASMSTHNV